MLSLAFAQDAQQAINSPQADNALIGLLPIAIIFVIFYFLLIRPQKKAQKDHQAMIGQIARNDEVVTSGGIFGTVVKVQDDVVTLRISDDTKIKIKKGSISGVVKARGEGREA